MDSQKVIDLPPDKWTFAGPLKVNKDELEALVAAIRFLIHRPDVHVLIDQDDITDLIRYREEQP